MLRERVWDKTACYTAGFCCLSAQLSIKSVQMRLRGKYVLYQLVCSLEIIREPKQNKDTLRLHFWLFDWLCFIKYIWKRVCTLKVGNLVLSNKRVFCEKRLIFCLRCVLCKLAWCLYSPKCLTAYCPVFFALKNERQFV